MIRTATRWPTISDRPADGRVPVPVDGDPRRLVLLDTLRGRRRPPRRAWALTVGGALLLAAGIVGMSRPSEPTPARPHVEGVVVEVSGKFAHVDGPDPVGHLGTIEYRVDGHTYRFTTPRAVDQPLVRGGRVPVYYAPDDPARADLRPGPAPLGPVLAEAALLGGLGCGGYGVWLLAGERRRRRQWDRVALAGIAVRATVTERLPIAQSWLLTAVSEEGRRRHRFNELWFHELGPGPEIGQAVTVYLDPEDPSRCLFGGLAG